MHQYWITLWSVVFVILAGVILAVFKVRRRVKTAPPPVQFNLDLPTRDASEYRAASEYWEPTAPDPRGRRKAYRRSGNHVLVQFTAPADAPRHGWVVNRSSSGLALAIDRLVVPGRVLMVLPSQAPAGTSSVEIRVLWCSERSDHYEIGCQFTNPVPPGPLLLFG